jgi:hypothetical protein
MRGFYFRGKIIPGFSVFLFTLLVLCFPILSCNKKNIPPPPVITWEDNGPDSTVLRILIQTPQGLILYGQYVNLALSQDSLNSKILVRRTPTNVSGVAVFRKLYPRVIYYNCYAVNSVQTYYGSGHIHLRPASVRDTVLIVY